MSEGLRDDFSQRAIVDTNELPWEPSPSPGVLRKRLDRSGPVEAGRVTSVVRYVPGSTFPSHPHPDGEEILVLSGVFSDEHGDYPAGTYLLNPEGFSHAPRTTPGCDIFVKLRQYPGLDRPQLQIDTRSAAWTAHPTIEHVEQLLLYETDGERTQLTRIGSEASVPRIELPGGEEIFVVSGSFRDEHGLHRAGTWLRFPPGSAHTPSTEEGCVLYVKKGHLEALISAERAQGS